MSTTWHPAPRAGRWGAPGPRPSRWPASRGPRRRGWPGPRWPGPGRRTARRPARAPRPHLVHDPGQGELGCPEALDRVHALDPAALLHHRQRPVGRGESAGVTRGQHGTPRDDPQPVQVRLRARQRDDLARWQLARAARTTGPAAPAGVPRRAAAPGQPLRRPVTPRHRDRPAPSPRSRLAGRRHRSAYRPAQVAASAVPDPRGGCVVGVPRERSSIARIGSIVSLLTSPAQRSSRRACASWSGSGSGRVIRWRRSARNQPPPERRSSSISVATGSLGGSAARGQQEADVGRCQCDPAVPPGQRRAAGPEDLAGRGELVEHRRVVAGHPQGQDRLLEGGGRDTPPRPSPGSRAAPRRGREARVRAMGPMFCQRGRNVARAAWDTGSICWRRMATERRLISRRTSGWHHCGPGVSGTNQPSMIRPAAAADRQPVRDHRRRKAEIRDHLLDREGPVGAGVAGDQVGERIVHRLGGGRRRLPAGMRCPEAVAQARGVLDPRPDVPPGDPGAKHPALGLELVEPARAPRREAAPRRSPAAPGPAAGPPRPRGRGRGAPR